MQFFQYSNIETGYLSRKDNKLGAVIRRLGMLQRRVTPDVFEALVECIVGQQISGKAAATVNRRLKELLGSITPETVAHVEPRLIQQCGMTLKKAHYIRTGAETILSGKININEFNSLSDDEIIDTLTVLPGVGRWTAEMILLHALQRPNVFSYDDLIIRRNLMSLHNLSEMRKMDFEKFRKRYSPYCSVAMIYLWRM